MSEASSVSASTEGHHPVHTLVLKCEGTDGIWRHSRLAVIAQDKTAGRYDYGLTTAHGLESLKACWVQDHKGRSNPLIHYRVAPTFVRDPYSPGADWAVIKFKRMKTKSLVRYALNDLTKQPRSVSTAMFARGRGLLHNTKPCEIKFQVFPVPPKGHKVELPSHNCPSQQGQSGTPLILENGSTPQLYGLHTGRSFVWRTEIGMGPRWFSRFILIDPTLVGQIEREVSVLDDV